MSKRPRKRLIFVRQPDASDDYPPDIIFHANDGKLTITCDGNQITVRPIDLRHWREAFEEVAGTLPPAPPWTGRSV